MPELDEIVEALLFASDKPLSAERLTKLLDERVLSVPDDKADLSAVRKALTDIQARYNAGVLQLKEVASGYRFQVRTEFSDWISLLFEEKPQRYSRALLETLVIIAYRQPVTRGDIEEIRGVAVSSQIIKTLQEREWIRIIGHKDIPGKPGLYATTRQFLDYFNLISLDQLPPLAEVRDLAEVAHSLKSMVVATEVDDSTSQLSVADDTEATVH